MEICNVFNHILHIALLVRRDVRGEERLSGRHPTIRLLTVSVKELQLQALVKLHASFCPRLPQLLPGTAQPLQLLLDLSSSRVLSLHQFLAELLQCLEVAGPALYLRPELLVTLQQSLGPRHVSGQLLGGDDTLHVDHPGHQVSVVAEEPLQVVRVQQLHLSLIGLAAQLSPLLVDSLLLLVDHLGAVLLCVHQIAGLLVQLLDLLPQSRERGL